VRGSGLAVETLSGQAQAIRIKEADQMLISFQ